MDHFTAQAEFDAIQAEVNKLARQIGFVSRVLETDPEHLTVSFADPCPPMPQQVPGDYCIEHGNWPSAETILNILNRYRMAKARLAALVPPAHREVNELGTPASTPTTF